MIITIDDKTKQSMNVLGIQEYPFTENNLKERYRALAMEFHPDINPEGKNKMLQIIEAYQWLKNLATSDGEEIEVNKILCDEIDNNIFNIYETCDRCHGKKFTSHTCPTFSKCLDCEKDFNLRSFRITVNCSHCNNGWFALTNGNKIICKSCNGTGRKRIVCPTCNSKGFLSQEKTVKEICTKCKGKGKVKLDLFNPVIRKGAVLR